VDPQRDISQYVATAGAHGLTIERVIGPTSTPTSCPATWS
jgi:hypothetical protein